MRSKKVAAIIPFLVLSLSAHAYTVGDLVENYGTCAVMASRGNNADRMPGYNLTEFQYGESPWLHSNQCHFEYVTDLNGKIRPTLVRLVDFEMKVGTGIVNTNFIFTLANDSNEPVTDGTRLVLENDSNYGFAYSGCLSENKKYALAPLYKRSDQELKDLYDNWDIEFPSYMFGTTDRYSFKVSMDYLVGEITPGTLGGLKITFAPAFFCSSSTSPSAVQQACQNSNMDHITDEVTIETFTPDGTFSATVHPYLGTSLQPSTFSTSGSAMSFPVKTVTNADGSLGIINLTGDGYGLNSSYEGITGEKRTDITPLTLTLSDSKVSLKGGEQASFATFNSGQYGARILLRNMNVANLTSLPDATFNYDDVESGTCTINEQPLHRVLTNHWVNYGGNLRTYINSIEASINPFAFVYHLLYDTSELYWSSPAYVGGTLSLNGTDITLDLNMTSVSLGTSTTQLWPQAQFQVNANDMFVDSYTLFMVPGSFKHGDVLSQDFYHDNGHINAFEVATVSKDELFNPGEGFPKIYHVGRLFNRTEMAESQKAASDMGYMYYIRANYTDITTASPAHFRKKSRDAGLHSTNHGMITASNTTSAPDLKADATSAVIRAAHGSITINGSDEVAHVYTPAGLRVACTAQRTIPVPPGLYIVRVGETVSRVTVR